VFVGIKARRIVRLYEARMTHTWNLFDDVQRAKLDQQDWLCFHITAWTEIRSRTGVTVRSDSRPVLHLLVAFLERQGIDFHALPQGAPVADQLTAEP
jgi:hypothetical protein